MSGLVPAGDVAIDAMGLDRDRVARLLAERARIAARPIVPREPGLVALVCAIGGERFAIPLAAVAEMLGAVRPTPVPGAPAALLGLFVWRGVVHNLVDPAPALGVSGGERRHMLLLRGTRPRLALLIDEAPGTTEIVRQSGEDDGGGLTSDRIAADGRRLALIAPARLVAALGLRRRD